MSTEKGVLWELTAAQPVQAQSVGQLLHFVNMLHQAVLAEFLRRRQPAFWCRCQNGAMFVCLFEGLVIRAGRWIAEKLPKVLAFVLQA